MSLSSAEIMTHSYFSCTPIVVTTGMGFHTVVLAVDVLAVGLVTNQMVFLLPGPALTTDILGIIIFSLADMTVYGGPP